MLEYLTLKSATTILRAYENLKIQFKTIFSLNSALNFKPTFKLKMQHFWNMLMCIRKSLYFVIIIKNITSRALGANLRSNTLFTGERKMHMAKLNVYGVK